MKTFALTAVAAVALLATASSADAQFYRYGGSYAAPSYSYGYSNYRSPVYSYPSYNSFGGYSVAPAGYTGPVGVGTYTPLGGTTIITPITSTGYYSPAYSTPIYGGPTYGSSYYGNTYGSGSRMFGRRR